ncbi:hypothetical protein EV196_107227 [Mariniflexile fucanivorans]|uniref:Uncharacterized protein n=1 Tax=Mariniflexile fucanivorans TaxID=264023 RepID=A0A4V2QDI2_9FLAO|nr:hypothetical protein [Mariniflexile fucanivorans]TCL64517.1 hypothetical protein EV196_107227 [Mariniflexile fucanivorans]
MYFFKRISTFALVCFTIGIQAQIITVIENDKNEKRTISLTDKQIVDINCSLEIQLSKLQLLDAIHQQFPELKQHIELESQLIKLQQALRNQSAVISILEKQLATASEQATFFEIMDGFLSDIQNDPLLNERYNDLMTDFFNPETFVPGTVPEPYIFSNLNNDMLQIEQELASMETEKYTISLLAFKRDASGGDRVHIQNYDTYTNRDYVTIARWVTSLSSDQKQQLEALNDIAKQNNLKKINVFNELKIRLLNEFKSISCIKEFKNNSIEFVNNIQLNELVPTEVKNKIEQLNLLISRFETLFQLLKTDMEQWQINLLFDIKNEVETIISHLKTIDTNFSDVTTLINQTRLKTKFMPLVSEFNTCYATINKDFETIKQGAALLFNLQNNYIANKAIGTEVLAFSLDNLPDTGYINLKGTGQRKNGDELLIELVLRLPATNENTPEQVITMEQREFIMQLTGPRSEVAIGLIFANPINKQDLNLQSDRNFFYTPSAALLLKFGSNTSYFYNDFLDFGIGINFATPDFNTDGTPEFGTGIIATAFKDIISTGINYNVTLDSFYWFFGVNLPFNLPGIPINNIKN